MDTRRLSKKEKAPFIIMDKDDLFRSYGTCKLTLTRPATNLNKIKIETNLKKGIKNYPSRYRLDVYYGDIKLKKGKEIGVGISGKVIIYQGLKENKEISVVVKMPLKDSDPWEEPYILKDYLKTAFMCHHYIIPVRSVEDQNGNPFIVMQQANGEVRELEMDDRLKIKFIIYITRIIKCFYNHKIIYPDLKLENILYRCNGEKIEFFLGDIGSFAQLGANNKEGDLTSGYSFVPPEYAYEGKTYIEADKESALYTLGATIAGVYGLDDDIYYADNNGNEYTSAELKKIQIPKFHKKVKASNIPSEVKEIVLAFTSISPKKRLEYDFDMVFDMLCPTRK